MYVSKFNCQKIRYSNDFLLTGQYDFQLLGTCGGRGIIEISDVGQWLPPSIGSGFGLDVLAARLVCHALGYKDAVSAVFCPDGDALLASTCWGRNQSSLPEWCPFTNDSVCSRIRVVVSCTRESCSVLLPSVWHACACVCGVMFMW